MKIIGWIVGIPVALFVLVFLFFFARAAVDPSLGRTTDAERAECVRAITSNIGTSTINYSDKQAYDRHVASKCSKFDLPK